MPERYATPEYRRSFDRRLRRRVDLRLCRRPDPRRLDLRFCRGDAPLLPFLDMSLVTCIEKKATSSDSSFRLRQQYWPQWRMRKMFVLFAWSPSPRNTHTRWMNVDIGSIPDASSAGFSEDTSTVPHVVETFIRQERVISRRMHFANAQSTSGERWDDAPTSPRI